MKNGISLITPVSKDLLYTKIADAVSDYIKNNHLMPGDKLPSERELAASFQTSRHTVREALRVLENQGIISSQIGSGTYVAHVEEESSLYLESVKINYLEMLNIKTELEKYAISLVAERVAAKDLEELESLLGRIEDSSQRGVFESDTDKQFHYRLSELSGNKMLAQMIKKMIEAFDEYYSILPQSTQLCLRTVARHRELLDAISRKDTEAAAKACDEILLIDQTLIMENRGSRDRKMEEK
ncbi:FadR family transcriptional regulator [Clostridium sp. AF19-22AC]|jgi:GntR family transcriptional repressor for pyruvate dehydrogenase complex|uniref:FadR/GntR family transcriptional regulator n=1 Tax=Clostridia TaxID=186801 RepID=UPI000E4AAFFB|nr:MULTISPECIES: FadR/GntR family transcriptional regulator [Clostridia]RHR27636.1 FadR family transcriptional regulator [Clostridium sp. AF19-22AC]